MSERYLLVAYKESSASYSMGCHMESYRSGSEIEVFDDREELLQAIARLQAADLGHMEAEWEFEVYRGDFRECGWSGDEEDDPIGDAKAHAERLRSEIKEDAARKRAAEVAAADNARAEAKEARDRRDWKRLKRKYAKDT